MQLAKKNHFFCDFFWLKIKTMEPSDNIKIFICHLISWRMSENFSYFAQNSHANKFCRNCIAVLNFLFNPSFDGGWV